MCLPDVNIPRNEVREFWTDNKWDEEKLRAALVPLGGGDNVVERIIAIPIDGEGRTL